MTRTRDDVTLVTYTYNDPDLAAGLLAAIPGWTVRPGHVVVVDDGSDKPFLAPAILPHGQCPVQVIRLTRNQGIAKAKARGLDAARGDFALSVDCDVRVPADYLERCLGHLERPGIGLVSGATMYDAGMGLVARYLRRHGDNHNLSKNGPVDFLPGNAFALRRAVWKEVGGFGETARSACEDHVLCLRIREAGYTLWADNTLYARQTRRLDRTTLCRRTWSWCHRRAKRDCLSGERCIPYLFELLVRPALLRFDSAAEAGEPLFPYLDLLYLSFAVDDVLGHAETEGLVGTGARTGFHAALMARLKPWTRLRALLWSDLTRMGVTTRTDSPAPCHPSGPVPVTGAAGWDDLLMVLDPLEQSGLLAWIDRVGMTKILAEDAARMDDFSSYADLELARA